MMNKKEFDPKRHKNLRYLIGDVRDYSRVLRATENVDYVIHAAAMKHVHLAEKDPFECIKTNIIGAQNLIQACIENNVKKVVALSTDKASSPINLYGASKLCSDKLFTSANNIKGNRNISFSVVRYGNVMSSNGSVIPLLLDISKNKRAFNLTDPKMTRFNISIKEAVDLVFWCLKNNMGGEIVVPKIPSYRILDLIKAVDKNIKFKIVGIRPGEKIHEEMVSENDSLNTFNLQKYYVIVSPEIKKTFSYYNKNFKKMKIGMSYRSDTNNHFLTIADLKKLILKK